LPVIAATAFVTALVGNDAARDTGIDKNVAQFIQPLQISLPEHDCVSNGLLRQLLFFLPNPAILLVQKKDRTAISAFLDMREILGFAVRTYLIQVHSSEEGRNIYFQASF
jgi:hypothetical protein